MMRFMSNTDKETVLRARHFRVSDLSVSDLSLYVMVNTRMNAVFLCGTDGSMEQDQ